MFRDKNEASPAVIVDFGTAKDLLGEFTNGPEAVGTPEYMSPEVRTELRGKLRAAETCAWGTVENIMADGTSIKWLCNYTSRP